MTVEKLKLNRVFDMHELRHGAVPRFINSENIFAGSRGCSKTSPLFAARQSGLLRKEADNLQTEQQVVYGAVR